MFSRRLPFYDLVSFCRILKHNLGAGLTLVQVLRQQSERGPPAVRPLAGRLHEALRQGGKQRPAKVINIASIDGVSVNPMETYSYAASKAGLIHLTKRMALRLAQDNIVVSGIAPGAFPSEMNREARDHGDKVSQRIPAGRVGTDEDMAGAAIFLAARAGDYVMGETIVVDGGVTHARG